MSFFHDLKNKIFWVTVAHIVVVGAGVAGAIAFPPAVPVIMLAVGAINGALPSPVAAMQVENDPRIEV